MNNEIDLVYDEKVNGKGIELCMFEQFCDRKYLEQYRMSAQTVLDSFSQRKIFTAYTPDGEEITSYRPGEDPEIVPVVEQLKSGDFITDLKQLAEIEVMVILQELGCEFNFTVNDFRERFLSDHKPLFQILRKLGCSYYDQEEGLYTGLMYSLYFSADNAFVAFLKKHIVNVDARDNSGYTPLMKSYYDLYPNIMQLLIELGADVNAQNNNGLTTLHLVAFSNIEFAKVLLDAKCDLFIKNNDGHTAGDYAMFAGNYEFLKLLANYQAANVKNY